MRALTRALDGLSQSVSDDAQATRVERQQVRFREQMRIDADKKMTAAIDRLTSRVERAMKLNREVGHEIAEGVRGAVREATENHQLPAHEGDEITGQYLKIRWATIAKYAPVAMKVFGVLAIAAGAVWATLARLAKYVPGLHH